MTSGFLLGVWHVCLFLFFRIQGLKTHYNLRPRVFQCPNCSCTIAPPSLWRCFSEKGPGPRPLGPLMAFPQPHSTTHKLLIGWGVRGCPHSHSWHPSTDTFLREFPMTKPRTHFRSGPGPKGSGCKWFGGPLDIQTCLLESHCRASTFGTHVWAGEHFPGLTLQILTHSWKHMSAHLPSPLEGSPHPRPQPEDNPSPDHNKPLPQLCPRLRSTPMSILSH